MAQFEQVPFRLFRIASAEAKVVPEGKRNAGEPYLRLSLKPSNRTFGGSYTQEDHTLNVFDKEFIGDYKQFAEAIANGKSIRDFPEFDGYMYNIRAIAVPVTGAPYQLKKDDGTFGSTRTTMSVFMLVDEHGQIIGSPEGAYNRIVNDMGKFVSTTFNPQAISAPSPDDFLNAASE